MNSVLSDATERFINVLIIKIHEAINRIISPSRYVSWTAYILRHHKSGPAEPLPLPGVPFSHYYAQENSDEGIIMETDVTVKEVRGYVLNKSQIHANERV